MEFNTNKNCIRKWKGRGRKEKGKKRDEEDQKKDKEEEEEEEEEVVEKEDGKGKEKKKKEMTAFDWKLMGWWLWPTSIQISRPLSVECAESCLVLVVLQREAAVREPASRNRFYFQLEWIKRCE